MSALQEQQGAGVSFTVPGIPQPQGSKTRTQWGGMREANKNTRPWRDTVSYHAREALTFHGDDGTSGYMPPLLGPVRVYVNFFFPRPKSHFTSKGALSSRATAYKDTKPDLDKLLRCLLDALTDAQVFRDDGQVAHVSAAKHYGETPGLTVDVWPYDPITRADTLSVGAPSSPDRAS